MPTATASDDARSSCTRRRDASPVTQRRPGTTTRPSSVTATLYVTNGRRCAIHVRQASFCSRASRLSTTSTSSPALRSRLDGGHLRIRVERCRSRPSRSPPRSPRRRTAASGCGASTARASRRASHRVRARPRRRARSPRRAPRRGVRATPRRRSRRRGRRRRRRAGSGASCPRPRSASSSALRERVAHPSSPASCAYAAAGSAAPNTELPGDEQPRTGRVDVGDVPRADAAVDLDRARDEPGEPLDALERLRHERLPRVTGPDRHAEDEIRVSGLRRARGVLDGRAGVERHAHAEPVLARQRGDRCRVVGGLDVERHRVGARLRELREVVSGVGHHQVTVENTTGLVDQRRDRAQHDRADRHRRDEVTVARIEVEDAAACLEQRLDLSPSCAKSAA